MGDRSAANPASDHDVVIELRTEVGGLKRRVAALEQERRNAVIGLIAIMLAIIGSGIVYIWQTTIDGISHAGGSGR